MQSSTRKQGAGQGGEAGLLAVTSRQPLQPSDTNQLVLQAARVAIHVRPRSPRLSPTSYIPLDTSWSAWSPTRHEGKAATAAISLGPDVQALQQPAISADSDGTHASAAAGSPGAAVRQTPAPAAAATRPAAAVSGVGAGGAGERLLADLMPSLAQDPSFNFGHGAPAKGRHNVPSYPNSNPSSHAAATAPKEHAFTATSASNAASPGPAAPLLAASWASGVWPSAAAGTVETLPDAEEEARRARRRHRKRVARIVVDHWKAFAAARLRALAAKRWARGRVCVG